jgi:hypothetical protein
MNESRAYALLGVSKDASPELLKKAYRRKCLACHPDKKGNTRAFLEMKEAYDFLSQPKPSWLEEFDVHFLRQYLFSIHKVDLSICKHPLFVKHFVEPVQKHVDQYKTYILRPTLEHMLNASIYYLEEEHLYIPLWHQEILFHGKIKVILEPQLPDSVELDDDNNLILSDLPEMITFGSISILTTQREREEKKIVGKGIPRIGTTLYDSSIRGDLRMPFSK